MDGATIAMFVFQTVITAIIGVASWGVKNAIGEMKSAITKLEAADKKNAEDIAAVEGSSATSKPTSPSSTRPGRTSSGSRTTSTRSSTSSYTGARQRRDKRPWLFLTT